MIPKEKIEQAANKYAIKVNKGFEGSELIVRRVASESDFKSGVRFAETELQLIAIEFSEWCTINAKPVTNGKALRYWRLYTYQSSISYSTQKLFAKFMAERDEK